MIGALRGDQESVDDIKQILYPVVYNGHPVTKNLKSFIQRVRRDIEGIDGDYH